ncbi:MAG: M1 family metallopeptidase [Bacteroidetes bacterium]|nr:MAG: M1 family metallopeptidase [Bacteroidota bacterium]
MRKITFLLLVAQSSWLATFSQYWQQQVNYVIDVTLHDKDNSLDAFEKIEYINNSPDTLKFIWLHIWPNAYKNDKTAFSNQMLINGNTKFYFSDKEQRGYINRLDFKVNNITCGIEDHPQYIDIIKVILPTPLPPSQKIIMSTPFHVQLPYNFSRGGHDGESYQVTQWYPKPAVYDKKGWHPMPYLEQGEYYSEFGNFDVRITLPKNYVVAATGELQNDQDEKQWLITRNNFSWKPIVQKRKIKGGGTKTMVQKFPASSSETKTLRYTQNNVHDFAWFADKRFIVNHDTCQLVSGKTIDVFTYYTPHEKDVWKNSVQYSKQAIRFHSSELGEYPYNIVSIVQGPQSFGGGMEYPTITVISPTRSVRELDLTISHEIGHNWLYGILATNERDHPWMDEGINSFYDHRYLAEHYKDVPSEEKALFETVAAEKLDQPIETTSEKFNLVNYALVAYYKTSEWLRWLQDQVGRQAFDKAMKEYYSRWQFKHPQPQDFKNSFEESTGRSLDSAFALLNEKGILPSQRRSGTTFDFFLKPKYFSGFLNNSYQNLITIGPSIGINSYDKFMVGAFLTNIKLPLNRFKFFIAPMYALGSKRFTGIGKLDYSFYPNGTFRKVDVFLNGSTFTENEYADSAGKKTYLAFQKIVPGIRFTFKEKDPRSSLHRFIQWKTFFIAEDGLRFSRDTVGNPPGIVTRIHKTKENTTLNQLLCVIENFRALYPYRGELKIEQAKDFVRTAFTGNCFFNYPKTGGLDVRLFAGKFFYSGSKTISKQFQTDRYHLNLTGANGYEDYTYSDYFIGRNKFEGLPSQQIMMRDGGFKIRTDLLASKVGKTDDWLAALNFTSSIPRGINPLSLLPIHIPLKVFLEIGTYADAWKQNSELDHFLFDGGLQLSLLKNTVNIYLPLIYSKVYKDYIQSTLEKKNRLWKTISFSIDISNFNLRKIDKNLSF